MNFRTVMKNAARLPHVAGYFLFYATVHPFLFAMRFLAHVDTALAITLSVNIHCVRFAIASEPLKVFLRRTY